MEGASTCSCIWRRLNVNRDTRSHLCRNLINHKTYSLLHSPSSRLLLLPLPSAQPLASSSTTERSPSRALLPAHRPRSVFPRVRTGHIRICAIICAIYASPITSTVSVPNIASGRSPQLCSRVQSYSTLWTRAQNRKRGVSRPGRLPVINPRPLGRVPAATFVAQRARLHPATRAESDTQALPRSFRSDRPHLRPERRLNR